MSSNVDSFSNCFAYHFPYGWLDSVIDFFSFNRDFTETAINRRWQERTGHSPELSCFTVVIPIHNEEKSLPGFIRSFLLSDIPFCLNIVVIFANNASNDRSSEIIDDFMHVLGKVVPDTELFDYLHAFDSKIFNLTRVNVGNIRFLHLETSFRGKPNVLTLANKLACKLSHPYVMSFDSDMYLQPDTISVMYANAVSQITQDPHSCAVLSVVPQKERFVGFMNRSSSRSKPMPYSVFGEAMVWDSFFVEKIGGIPCMATQDYALGLLARLEGRKINVICDTTIWGYIPSDEREIWNMRSRFIRGKIQLVAFLRKKYPHMPFAEEILRNEWWYMGGVKDRIKTYLQWIAHDGHVHFTTLVDIFKWEFARFRAYIDFFRDPFSQSWRPVRSSKR